MKKYIIKYSGGLLVLLALTSLQSCDKNFSETNTNPDAVSAPIPQYVFTKAEYDGSARMLNLLLGTMQYTTSFNDVAGFGSKYIASQYQQTYAAFTNAYSNEINELGIVLKTVKNDPAKTNWIAEARIWKAYCFSRLTDLYGDIPYSQSALGYDSGVYKPAYDAQKDIYASILSELDQAAQSLDASKSTFGAADLIYGGAVGKWKKFAYSLMLRCAMRMTKVDAAAAKTWATKAIAGGVITDDADIAKIKYTGSGQDINKNPFANALWTSDYIASDGKSNQEGGKYQKAFIDSLIANSDPRLPVISVVWNNGVPDNSASIQKGMAATWLNSQPPDFATYSEPNPKTVLLLNSPLLVFTAAESYFLLSEAAARNWYTGATAIALYQKGIEAAMRQWSIIGGSAGTISSSDINNYVTAKLTKFSSATTLDAQMKEIYTEFWVSIFPDAQEVFASYRRTGYPALTPNNVPANITGGKIFRRMMYPLSEQTLNVDSYNAAVSRQGANDLLTRVWWDK